jgi:chaperonin GroES
MSGCPVTLTFFISGGNSGAIITGKKQWHRIRSGIAENKSHTINQSKKTRTMANPKIKPLADRVVVEAAAAEEKTAGGIIIPDTAKEKPQRGKVVAVGSGKKDEPITVKVGDTVLYGKYSGTEVQIDGKDYLIMRESDIFAVI